MMVRKGKFFVAIISYMAVLFLWILSTRNLNIKNYSFFTKDTVFNARFHISMNNIATYYTTYHDPACDVKYAIIVFERGIESRNHHLLFHVEENNVNIFSSGRSELLLHGVEHIEIRKDNLTVQDLLSNIRHGNPSCWRSLEFVVYCRNTTLVNVKNVLDMLEFRGKVCFFDCGFHDMYSSI